MKIVVVAPYKAKVLKTIEALEKVEEYKRLEEQGLLLRLPVKIGDTVYIIDGDEEEDWIDEYEVKYFYSAMKQPVPMLWMRPAGRKNTSPALTS